MSLSQGFLENFRLGADATLFKSFVERLLATLEPISVGAGTTSGGPVSTSADRATSGGRVMMMDVDVDGTTLQCGGASKAGSSVDCT